VDARSTPQVEGAHELSGKSNYFIGNDRQKWRTGVRQYAKVKYTGVYPGVDLIYYGNQRELEYDFSSAWWGPSKIKLGFQGAKDVSINRGGGADSSDRRRRDSSAKALHLSGARGERREIEGQYVKTGTHEVGFEVAEYDATKPLVIDLTLAYSTYLGASNVNIVIFH
jgi:hypothetical protein